MSTKRPNDRRPTMKDVAERARVSVSTVSYVLNKSGPVAEPRRKRVLDAVRVLNYTPNESARGLKQRSSPTVGLVIPELSNQFFALLAEGVERAASERDALVVFCAPTTHGSNGSTNARLLRSQRLSGVIYLSGGGTSPESLMELTRLGPVVLVDERIPGFEVPAVVSDGRRGAREVAQYVFEQGHERVAVIGGPISLWTAEQRLAGYREAAASAGQDPDEMSVLVGDYHQPSGAALAAELLAAPAADRPTALLCANDLMAVGALEYCKAAGISVPHDVSIVGFDDLPFVSLLTPSLTTVRQRANDMGYRAATLLFDMLNGEDDPQAGDMFPVEVKIRDSVAAPLCAK